MSEQSAETVDAVAQARLDSAVANAREMVATLPGVPPIPVEVRPGVAEAATFEALMAKARRTAEIKIPNPAGGVWLVSAAAIGYDEYDQLVADCPPKEKDARSGGNFELDKFGPRLLARCLTAPALSVDDATKLWHNPAWSGGEIVDLFRQVNDLCQRGLNVPFIAPG